MALRIGYIEGPITGQIQRVPLDKIATNDVPLSLRQRHVLSEIGTAAATVQPHGQRPHSSSQRHAYTSSGGHQFHTSSKDLSDVPNHGSLRFYPPFHTPQPPANRYVQSLPASTR